MTCAASIIVCHAIIVNEATVERDRTVVLTFLMSFTCSETLNLVAEEQTAEHNSAMLF